MVTRKGIAAVCGIETLESRVLLAAGQLDPTFGDAGIARHPIDVP